MASVFWAPSQMMEKSGWGCLLPSWGRKTASKSSLTEGFCHRLDRRLKNLGPDLIFMLVLISKQLATDSTGQSNVLFEQHAVW